MGENTYGFLPPTILLLWTPPPLPLSFPSTVDTVVRPTFTGPRGVRLSTPRPTDRSRSGHAVQVRRGLIGGQRLGSGRLTFTARRFVRPHEMRQNWASGPLRLGWRMRLTTKGAGIVPLALSGLEGALALSGWKPLTSSCGSRQPDSPDRTRARHCPRQETRSSPRIPREGRIHRDRYRHSVCGQG